MESILYLCLYVELYLPYSLLCKIDIRELIWKTRHAELSPLIFWCIFHQLIW